MNTSGTKSIFSFTKRISFSAFFAVNALVAFPVFNALAYEETLPPPPPAVCAAPVDVMLVLDRSGSMAHDEWGFPIYPQPLAAVKSGAVAFVNTLSETNDAVGLVSFSEHATVDSSLGTDFAVVKNQINSLTADGWTNIAEALTKADEEFSLNGRADDTKKVIILLSDGNSNRPLPESAALADALAKAAIAKSHGITIYSIALGEFDETELKSISSGTDFYFHSPTTEELNAIYLAISAKECERIPAVGKGTVFEDLNKNTTRDSGEPGLSGRTIVLKDKKTESPASDRSVTSDSEGKYVFEDIIPGTYDVCANAIADFEQTTPTTSSKCYENMVVNEGDTIENLDFGFSKIHVNTAPIADAGPDRTVTLGDEITFDGSGSTDDGEIVAYDWNFGDESTTTNAATTTVHTYTATSTYTVTLVVTDDEEVASAPDTAIITVVTQCSDGKDNDGDNKIDFPADPGCSSPDDNDERDVNARPIADAGSYGVMTLGDDVIIDGSGSTDDGEIVLYEWNFGDESPLEATSTPRTPHIYTATSTYTITLVVTDNDGATSTPDTATITVATQCSDGKDNDGDHKIDYPTDPGCDSPDDNDEKDVNTRPIAEAGPDRTVTLGDNEIFDGSGSTDKDGEIVLYEWNFGDESPLATTTSSSARHIYTATSTYTIALVVKDNDGATSTPDTARITIVTQCSDGKDNDGDHKIDYPTDPGCSSPDDNDENDVNKRPIADAGRDRVVTLGDDEIFDGSGSIDEDGKVVLYSWDFGDGSTTTIGVATTTHVFTATSTYAVKLVVTDNDGATSTPDTVTVTVAPQCFDGKDNDGDHKIDYPTDPGCRWYDDNDERDVNVRPVADAGPDKIVTLGDAVTLDGSGSTDDKKIVSYEWNFGDGSTTTNAVATTSRTYTATSTYTVTLTVMDDEGAVSDPDTAIITVATQCSDGKDNDGDGKIDYPADPGCDSTDDNDEGDNKLPVAILFANPTSEHINKLISLDGKESYDSDGIIALYEWNFGDGVIATSTTASTTSHAYGTLGAYTATLVVTDNEGATSTPATKTITITTPPPTGCVSNCGGGGGGGGGGSVIQPTLQITNEVVEKGPVSGTALVKWQTNLPSDSRVVYGTSSVTSFPIGDSKYGYQIDTTTLSNLITSHTMAIFGLNPNLTYYFRPLSKTSTLSAIGKELNLAPSECYYLREFIKYGENNNPIEVKKLQVFLNEFEGENLPVTGFYDLASFNAVTLFQNKYKTSVIEPWGKTSLGYVYLTTRKQVNEIYCKAAFPLDGSQTMEVNAYRALMEALRAQGLVTPQGTVLGVSDNNAVAGITSSSSEQANGNAIATVTPEINKVLPVTNRGAFTNMLGSAYSSVAGTVSSNWLSLLLFIILIPTGIYAVKLYKEEETDTDGIFDGVTEEKEKPEDII